MALSTNAFIDRTYFNLHSGEAIVEGSNDDLKLINIINSVTDIFESLCNRKLKARDFSYDSESEDYDPEYSIFDPPEYYTFWFPTYPINSLTTFIISADTITAATSYDATDGYFLYKHIGKLIYSYGFDSGYNQNVKAVWNGGYNSNHKEYENLQYLTYLVTKKLWDSDATDSEIISEKLGNYSYTKANPRDLAKFFGLPPFVFEQIFKFKRFPIG